MVRAIEQLKQAMEVCELGALSLPDQIDSLMDAGKAVLQEVSTLTPPNEWISVDDRLPEDDAPEHKVQIFVLVLTDRGVVKIKNRTYHPTRFHYGKFYPEKWDWGTFNDDHITHWMPLPAPPERQEDNTDGD